MPAVAGAEAGHNESGKKGGVTIATAAKLYFSSPAVIKQYLGHLDMALKAELLWFELSSSIFWISALEIFFISQMAWVWTTHTSELSGLWIHIFHLARGVIGLFIVFKLPNSHDLIKQKTASGADE
jgi:hypothetical protein